MALSFFTAAARRGLALADHFREAGHTVVAGGIFPTAMPDEVQPHVDAVVTGEGEWSWRRLLDDHRAGRLAPRYGCDGEVDLEPLPLPRVDLYLDLEDERFCPDDYPVQLSRGCAMTCEACVLPLSMTRRLRTFSLDHVLGQIDQLDRAGRRACLTEDTSWFPGHAGRRLLVALLTRLVEEGREARVSYIGISMPMLKTLPTRVLDLARQAGVGMFYLVGGFDPITRQAFTADPGRAWQRGLDAVRRAHDAGIEPYTSFLIGNDDDDEGTPDRMLEFAEQAGIRKAEFAIATPYPGTPRWHQLVAEDRILTRDWSRYNDANVVFQPAQMSPERLHEAYLGLWRDFYATRPQVSGWSEEARTIQF